MDVPEIAIAPHDLLELARFAIELDRPIGELGDDAAAPARAALAVDHPSPLPRPDDRVRAAVRDLLRQPGFKPTGRAKPASEYLAAAAAEGRLGSINPIVDAGNAASLHGGLPISAVDLDRVRPPLSIGLPPAGTRYVFNAAGQEIEVGGLLSFGDADGPCANAVKDAQRSKTDATTRRVLFLVWGTRELPGRAAAVAAFARSLVADVAAR